MYWCVFTRKYLINRGPGCLQIVREQHYNSNIKRHRTLVLHLKSSISQGSTKEMESNLYEIWFAHVRSLANSHWIKWIPPASTHQSLSGVRKTPKQYLVIHFSSLCGAWGRGQPPAWYCKEEIMWTNSISSYDRVVGCRDRRKAIDVICMSHSKSFDSVPCHALIKAFRRFGLNQGLRARWPLPPALSHPALAEHCRDQETSRKHSPGERVMSEIHCQKWERYTYISLNSIDFVGLNTDTNQCGP